MWELQEKGAKKGTFTKDEAYFCNFLASINDELNMPKALAVVWDLLKDAKLSINQKYSLLLTFDTVLGLNLSLKKPKLNIPKEILKLAQDRENSRKKKDWKAADELRKKIEAKGYFVADSSKGFEITKS